MSHLHVVICWECGVSTPHPSSAAAAEAVEGHPHDSEHMHVITRDDVEFSKEREHGLVTDRMLLSEVAAMLDNSIEVIEEVQGRLDELRDVLDDARQALRGEL